MKNILIVFLFVILGWVFLFIILPYFIYQSIIPFKNMGLINDIDIGSFIGFFGSIIGGILTLIGVWLTISFQMNNIKKERAIQLKPVLQGIKGSDEANNIADIILKYNILDSNILEDLGAKSSWFDNKPYHQENIYIKNKGRGETGQFKIDNHKLSFYDIKNHKKVTETVFISSYEHFDKIPEEINVEESLNIAIKIPKFLPLNEKLITNYREFNAVVDINMRYSDMFNLIQYIYKITVTFNCEVNIHNIKIDESGRKFTSITIGHPSITHNRPKKNRTRFEM